MIVFIWPDFVSKRRKKGIDST